MYFAEAQSFNDGIDFYVSSKGRNITISSRRDPNGEVIVTRNNTIKPIKKGKDNPLPLIAISIVASFILECCNNWKIEALAFLAIVWIFTLGYYYIDFRNPNNVELFKYHAAEHKVLNYLRKYSNPTLDCDEVMKMSSVSVSCGSTVIAVILVLVTLSMLGILFIPWLVLKIIWCIASIFITLYLWANGKCNFLQKFALQAPERDKVEVAVLGMWEYVKAKNE